MKANLRILILLIVLLAISLIAVFIYQKRNIGSPPTGTTVNDVSPEARKSLESLVNYADQLPEITPDSRENIFVLSYRKNVNGNLDYYIGIARGTEKAGFHLLKEVPMPSNTYGIAFIYFVDFNNDHLDDIYVLFFTDLASKNNDGLVLIQNKPGEFVVADTDPNGLFKYTSGPGVPPKFEDVDGDGSLEITTVDIRGLGTPEISKTMRILKLRGSTFYLLKEAPIKN